MCLADTPCRRDLALPRPFHGGYRDGEHCAGMFEGEQQVHHLRNCGQFPLTVLPTGQGQLIVGDTCGCSIGTPDGQDSVQSCGST